MIYAQFFEYMQTHIHTLLYQAFIQMKTYNKAYIKHF